jgi:glycosyltransferase involved in cell wall biosynthesis
MVSAKVSDVINKESGDFTVSVVICTRNRPTYIQMTIESILAATSHYEQLVILDQSTEDATEMIVRAFETDPRVAYVRLTSIGLGASRETAIEMIESDIIAFVDDDCTVEPDWLDAPLATYREFPKVAMTFGQVLAVDHDTSAGFIPAYHLVGDNHVRTYRDKRTARGIGANMTVRRASIIELGSFDPSFGAHFNGCEDGDMTIRTIMAGQEVYECQASVIQHYGYRDFDSGKKNTLNNFIGIGAACAKPIKCGHPAGWHVAIEEGINRALLPFLKAVITLHPPFGWTRVSGFTRGFIEGLNTPLDPKTNHYKIKK